MIAVAGLTNVEINLKTDKFPLEYMPVCYPCFGVDVSTSGVAFNVAKALNTLGSDVALLTLGAEDSLSSMVNKDLQALNLKECRKIDNLKETPQSVNVYDTSGRRRIFCDLKDIQECSFDIETAVSVIRNSDAAVLCNINFARPMLSVAKEAGVPIVTDVHVLSNPEDEYDMDFFKAADVLFLSNEDIKGEERGFIRKLAKLYKNLDVIVVSMGADGAMLYHRSADNVKHLPAVKPSKIVNTIGAGDALLSAFTHFRFTRKLSAEESLTMAQKFASIKIGVSGAANGFATEAELF